MKYLVSLHQIRPPGGIGSKAHNLHTLWRKKFPIPRTYICTWQAYLDYHRAGCETLARVAQELAQVIRPGKTYAVRSSANIEDGAQRSFAGQFTTLLNVGEVQPLAQAVQAVWDTAQTEEVQTYLRRGRQPESPLLMAVIIQEMVESRLAGVAFSHNPLTGQEEIIVEAVRGAGTQLVQAGITPLRWVSRWGVLLEQPPGEAALTPVIEQISAQTQQIAQRLRREVDLEWVYDGQNLYWVQLRDITALRAGDVYHNRIAREMTPGLIKPLVWSVSIPVPSGQWVRLLNELVGETQLQPQRLVKAFHYRAYFNMGQFGRVFASLGMPPDALERMMGVLPPGVSRPKFMPGPSFLLKVPRLLRFAVDKLTFGGRVARDYPHIRAAALALAPPQDAASDPTRLLERVEQIVALQGQVSYNTIISILLMQLYHLMLGRALHRRGVDFSRLDLTGGARALDFDPNPHLAELHRQFLRLPLDLQTRLRQQGWACLEQEAALADFRAQFAAFLARFGHVSDSTIDFTSVPWRETPGLILNLLLDFEEPRPPETAKAQWADLPAQVQRDPFIGLIYRRARQFRLLREMYSGLYTETLLLLRDCFHLLGARLVREGRLAVWDEIFYLYLPEVRAWAQGAAEPLDLAALVAARQAEMCLSAQAEVPEVIYGETPPPLVAANAAQLCGIPTSRGYCVGPVKVVRGLADFPKVEGGDVLVIPYSDVGWTPLFARAGAVIAESGGILSHSSIVAREYNLPAVVSVAGAMTLSDGDLVEVDGFTGRIYVRNGSNLGAGGRYAGAGSA